MNIFDLFKKIESAKSECGPVSYIIAGLGNPGAKYEKTRHNAGFIAIDHIAEKLGVKIDRARFDSLCAEANIGDMRVLLMKPQTFMNNSGTAIAAAAKFYKIAPENILILHDEISFDAGIIRIRRKGSAGGHNGLKSIIAHLGSEQFPRIKIGVTPKPRPDYDLADWVLAKFPNSELEKLASRLDDISSAASMIAQGKIDDAMAKYSK